jgi:hypothetical protein
MDDDANAPDEARAEAEGEQPTDDLKRIKRISREAEHTLHAADVRTFEALALMSPDEIAEIVSISPQRIARENWTGQARKLAEERSPAGIEQSGDSSEERPRYETFTVRLSVGEANQVINTTVTRVMDEREARWAGWQTSRLLDFLSEYANLGEEDGAVPPPAEPTPTAPVAAEAAPSPGDTRPEVPAARKPEGQVTPAPSPAPTPIGRLRELEVVSLASGQPQRLLARAEPFTVRLMLDLQEAGTSGEQPLEYAATISAKRFDGGRWQTAGRGSGTLAGTGTAIVETRSDGLPPGLYRLEVTVRLRHPTSGQPPRLLSAVGGVLEVD